MTRPFRRMAAALIVGLLAALAGVSPVFADPPGPTDYLSEVRSIDPSTTAIDVSIIGGDSFFEMQVEPGVEAMVVGYQGEDYLWFQPDGTVLENRNSPAAYLNAQRYGTEAVPPTASADAEPRWEQVAGGGHWAWHDHRAHWMQSARPFGLGPGDQILEAVIPIVVDGDVIEVTVISTWQPEPSPVPMWFGFLAGLATAVAAWLLRRTRVPAMVAAVPLVMMAFGVGLAQYTSLPAATGPRLIWIVLPSIALLCVGAGLALAWRGQRFAADAALLLVGVELAVWGFAKRDGFSAAIIPTDAPFWLDRFTTAAALLGGVALAAGRAVVALRHQQRQRVAGQRFPGQRFQGADGLAAPGPPVSTS